MNAHEYLREWLKGWEQEEWYEAVSFLALDRYKIYKRAYYIRTIPMAALLFLTAAAGCLGIVSFWLSLALMFALVVLGRKNNTNAYRRYHGILTQDCDARQAVIAFLMLAEKGPGLRFGPSFQEDYMTATALYAGGFDQTAMEYMELVYGQLSERKRRNANVVLHYRNLRVKCLRRLGQIQAAAKEKTAIEDYVAANPKCRNSSWYKQYCEIERIYEGIALRDYHTIRENAETFLAKAGSVYNKVTGHYLMYCIEKGIGNPGGAQEHADYVREHGGGLAIVKEVEDRK